ncbi:MDR family NADP-dependent oxidoreductase [Microbacterium sp. zg.Y909]|uniref:MDR family NADP-dependent oxidoreductase n=1 Tax=Microbacterium sp. zg.Y909 TaxID=2969413 RepID=UPI00214B4F74|nr:NADP-dependent oxidoreductase [Microbacterium sp. zg.Y909]MCR2824072.1 NADP-dependent oxidoreductase [Microbacterium sp. zg.Y909]
MATSTREIWLDTRLSELPRPEDFSAHTRTLADPRPGEVLVRTTHLAMDPGLRSRFRDEDAPHGTAVIGQALGVVAHSEDERTPPGARVRGRWEWAEYAVATAADLDVVATDTSPAAELGPLGWAGQTAYVGIFDIARPRPGEVIFISSAAGTVGLLAGQFAKRLGAYVIGSAGGAEKVDLVLASGFDAAFDYKAEDPASALARLAPGGLDIYFDNVGGAQLQAAFEHLRMHGRTVCCGSVSGYNSAGDPTTLTGLRRIVTNRLSIRGFVLWDHPDAGQRREQILTWLNEGDIVHPVTEYRGLDSAPSAFIAMLSGHHPGRTIVAL